MADARPRFDAAWTLFQRIHGNGSLANIGKVAGGKVKANIDARVFKNGCALRMSYVLNRVGVPIRDTKATTVYDQDGHRNFFRVKDVLPFLQARFGPADLVVDKPTAAAFKGRRGILLFEVSVWDDSTGHATLWNGVVGNPCADHCYFAEAFRAHLWLLP
ncbi:MAG: hypothetical protein RL701_7661 [Pseudomonadota bacterium]|jgi:hypothetical protein